MRGPLWVLVAIGGLTACSSDTGPSTGRRGLTGSLVAGANFTCALDHAGTAFCWGADGSGQLGNGATTGSPTPVRVQGGPYTALTAADTAVCGLRPDGSVDCWGGVVSKCCAQTQINLTVPTSLAASMKFSAVSLGTLAACGLDTSHHGFCWGSENTGSLGNGEVSDTALPPAAAISGGMRFASIDAGVFGGCGIDTQQAAWCWGGDVFGELGIGDDADTAASPVPAQVSGGLSFTQLSVGGAYVCGVTTTGFTECWGENVGGALGDGTNISRSVPTPVVGADFVAVFAGGKNDILDHTCALTASGAASCWGANDRDQLGATSDNTCPFGAGVPCSVTPLPVGGGLTFKTLAVGDSHTCGMVADGHVYCWGTNDDGELGDGSTSSSPLPVRSLFTP